MSSERFNIVLVLTVMVIATLHMQVSDAQNTHTVGDSTGWTIPPHPNTYKSWAASQTFAVGDNLVFNFPTGMHTAAEVTKDAYDACNTEKPIAVWANGPATVPLKSSGPHYYLCTLPGHCSAGQKLAITI
ncbi:hypothetical protein DCAR_0312690 [Daucus carota subsp. sativus]|uniref:Phytocyanin domain-containing protein n=2 Tax=Daucus carota subsp. sativus TaxID=79200 RepID=A0AAF1AUW9_DAUCS|nr:PREDICTED: mavicyanin-like [Daucus carota subsp. sativus]WOG93406.1 hypothetical protein DCAR_0312690 [Daucus carota subsp. sativus]